MEKSLNTFIIEAKKDPRSLKSESSIMNALYDAVQPYTSKLYKDDHWAGKNDIVDALGQFGETEVTVKDGGYRKNKEGQEWKEWQVHLTLVNKFEKTFEFDFKITAHQAGSMQDPWDRYDMTMTRQYISKK